MPGLSDGDRLPYEIGILVAQTRRALWTAAARELEANDFSMLHWVLIAHLVRNGPSTQRKIAAATAQHPAGVSRTLVELEGLGLIRRRRDPSDRRRSHVEITAAGRKAFEQARPHVIGALRQELGALTLDERRTFRALLGKLCPSVVIETDRSTPKRTARAQGAQGTERKS
ncbi:MAG: MarR family winged helix-turn-helix transcriptional regulator [Byssovorax sp.]